MSKEQDLAVSTHDRTLLVSAGAGAGKTHTLTRRIIESLCREEAPASISRLLVVTFTRAAAEELRTRISAALCDALAKNPENRHLAEQLLLLPAAPIRTIDSFCIDLVRRNADLMGISPSFRPAEEAELGLCFRGVMEEMLEEGYRGTLRYGEASVSQKDFEEMAQTLSATRDEEGLPEILEKLYDGLQSFPERCELLLRIADGMEKAASTPTENPWIDTILSHAKEALAHAHATLSYVRNEVEDGPGEAVFLALADSFLHALRQAQEATDYLALRQACHAFTPEESLPTARAKELHDKGAVDRLKDGYKDAAKIFLSVRADCLYTEKELSLSFLQMSRIHKTLGCLLSAFHERYFEKKKQLGILDFSDTKQMAYSLLYNKDGSRTEAAAALQNAYDEIYIDEYQDVNAVEHAIFEAISTPKNRFMVGDIKQSIYGFRGSDPDIFARLKKDFPTMDPEREETLTSSDDRGCLFLSRNYRSLPPILDYTNAVFRTLFSVVGDSIGYVPQDDLTPSEENEKEVGHLPVTAFFHLDSSVKEIDYLEAEIRRLTSGERKRKPDPSPEGVPVTEENYRIKMRDITVLCRGNDTVRALAAQLESRGIPTVLSDESTFFFNPEVQLAVALLNTVSNPLKDTYLAGVLCSPLYRFTLDEAIRMRLSHPEGPLLHAVRAWAEGEEGEKAREFLADLRRFRLLAEGLSADRFLRILYRETGLLATAGRGGKRRDNLLLLYNFARRFEATSFRGLYRFIRYVNEIIRTGASFSAPTSSEQEDAVRVMTVHKSKGLQAPVVFVSHVGSVSPKEPDKDVSIHPTLGLPLRPRAAMGLIPLNTPVRRAIFHEIFRKEQDESMRILYVALTRAAERLYVTGSLRGNEGYRDIAHEILKANLSPYALRHASWYDWIRISVPDRLTAPPILPEREDSDGSTAPDEGGTVNETVAPDEGGTPRESADPDRPSAEEVLRELKERFDWSYPHAALTEVPGKLSVSLLYPGVLDPADGIVSLDAKSEPHSPAVPRFLSHKDKSRAAKAGTATHLFMQFCNYARLAKNGAAAEVEQLKADGFLTPRDAALVNVKEAQRFAESPFPAFLASADLVRREFRFHMSLPAHRLASLAAHAALGDEEVLVQGVIDCLVHVGDEIVLIDYKSDRLTEKELASPLLAAEKLWQSHGAQMGYYAAAVRYVFGKYPSRCLLYSMPLGDAVEKNVKECLQYANLLEDEHHES